MENRFETSLVESSVVLNGNKDFLILPYLKAICSICLQELLLLLYKRKRNAFLRFNLPGLTEPFMQVIQAFNFIPIDYTPKLSM